MSHQIPDIDSDVLLSVVEHVFLPPKLPQTAQTKDAERATNVALCHILMEAAQAFSDGLSKSPLRQSLWARMIKMMSSLYWAAKSPLGEAELKGTLSELVIQGRLEPLLRIASSFIVAFRCLRNAYSSSECRCRHSHPCRSCSIRDIRSLPKGRQRHVHGGEAPLLLSWSCHTNFLEYLFKRMFSWGTCFFFHTNGCRRARF